MVNLIGGLVFIGIPIAYNAVGYDVIRQHSGIFINNQCDLVSNFKLVHHHHSYLVCWNDLVPIYASKGEKKQKKLGYCRSFRMANNGFHGVILDVAKAATKACLTELQMLHQWIAKWDYLFYWRPYRLD
jgi:hypothetical protein